jgi:LPS-assembly lipoprotein
MPGRRALLALTVASVVHLGGCGWEPLYADRETEPASDALAAIKVLPINERIGQRLEWALRAALNPRGEPVKPLYTLGTGLTYSVSSLGLQTQGTYTLGQVDVHAVSTLIENSSGKVLLTISLHDQNSFRLDPNQYSTTVGQDDAQKRTVAGLNDEIVRRLTIFMEQRAAEKEPKKAEAQP